MRPSFISEQDISRWDSFIAHDPLIRIICANNPPLLEVLYAGFWLEEMLQNLQCSAELISRIKYTAGQLSFNQDPWQIAQEILTNYKENQLEITLN